MVAQSGHPSPLPSCFHFHRISTFTPLVFMRMRRLCSVTCQSVCLAVFQCILPMRGYDQIKMVVVLLLALCTPVNAIPPLQRTRDEIIRILFEQGFQYGLILCFLVSVYAICISLSTLKRCLKRQHLKQRGNYSDLQHFGRCVYFYLVQWHRNNHAFYNMYNSLSSVSLALCWAIELCT